MQLHPDRPALLCDERTVSWREFAARVARLAGAFRERGVVPGDRIAIVSNNSDRYVEFYFATLWCGGVILPINTRASIDEMAACIDDA